MNLVFVRLMRGIVRPYVAVHLRFASPGRPPPIFGFTSSLPAQLLRAMAPALQPLFEQGGRRTASTGAGGA